MSIYGYCRISTAKQSIDRQIRNVRSHYPKSIIFQEVFTGTQIDGRKKWEQLMRTVKAGDTIVFDSVSRMSRNDTECMRMIGIARNTYYKYKRELMAAQEGI